MLNIPKKPVLLAFKSTTCSGCKLMEANVWSDAGVQEILRNQVVLATLYVDDKTLLPESEQIVSTLDGKIKNTLGRKQGLPDFVSELLHNPTMF